MRVGSSLHVYKAMAHPRWEDYEYEYINDNPIGWLGNGWTDNERKKTIEVDYFDDDKIDYPSNLVENASGISA